MHWIGRDIYAYDPYTKRDLIIFYLYISTCYYTLRMHGKRFVSDDIEKELINQKSPIVIKEKTWMKLKRENSLFCFVITMKYKTTEGRLINQAGVLKTGTNKKCNP